MFYMDINDSRTICFSFKNGKISIIENFTKKRARLIINPPALVRFVFYPNLSKKHLHCVVQNSLQEHFPVDLKEYTTDYRVLSTGATMLVAVKTSSIEEYIRRAGINVLGVDLHQNFAGKYIANWDRQNIMLGTSRGHDIVLQFMENGQPTAITNCDYTNLERIFSPYISIEGKAVIERAYLPKTADPVLPQYLHKIGVQAIMFEEVYDLQQPKYAGV